MSTPYHSSHTGAEVDAAVDRANITWLLAARLFDGTHPLVSSEDLVTVSGLGLSFTPVRGFITIESPADGEVLFGVIVKNSLSADGFQVQLSAEPDAGGYEMHYLLFGASGGVGSSESGESSS